MKKDIRIQWNRSVFLKCEKSGLWCLFKFLDLLSTCIVSYLNYKFEERSNILKLRSVKLQVSDGNR